MAEEKRDVLNVSFLGGFSVRYCGMELIDARQSASQFCALMETILYFHEDGASRALLKEMLFEGREIDDAQHAIRNVIYTAKRRLREAGLPEVNYIEVRKGSYFWTEEIPAVLDSEEMLRLKAEAERETDSEKKLALLLDACHLYKGGFLEQLTTAAWTVQEGRKLRDAFQSCVEQAAQLLREKKDFRQMKALGEYAVTAEPFAEWEVLIVEAMACLGRYEQARDFCEETIDRYVQEYGQRTSSYVRELANRLSAHLIHQYEKLDDIQDKLVETDEHVRGGYYCSYPVFQEIYRILARTMDRQEDRIFIMLCTVVDSKGNPMREGEKLDKLSDRLVDAIVRSVRHSDTVTKYGRGQYLVLLMNTTRENCGVVQRRVDKNFLVGRQRTGIEYAVKSVIVSPAAVSAGA